MTEDSTIPRNAFFLKAYGYPVIFIAAYFIQRFVHDILVLRGDLYFTYPFIVLSTLFFFSGIGIVSRNRFLFLLTFYAYVFLATFCLFDALRWQGAEIIGQFQYQMMKKTIMLDLLAIAVTFLAVFILLRRSTLAYFHVANRAQPIRHIVLACIISSVLLMLWDPDMSWIHS